MGSRSVGGEERGSSLEATQGDNVELRHGEGSGAWQGGRGALEGETESLREGGEGEGRGLASAWTSRPSSGSASPSGEQQTDRLAPSFLLEAARGVPRWDLVAGVSQSVRRSWTGVGAAGAGEPVEAAGV